MALRLFIFKDGDEVASFGADHVPRVGEELWFKTTETTDVLVVEKVEHQFDRSNADTYGNQDVCLYCRRK